MVKELDSAHDNSRYNPYETAGWLSRMLFLWPNKLVQDGASKTLTQEDLPVITREDRSSFLNKLLLDQWEAQKRLPNPSLLKAMYWAFAPKYGWMALILLAESVIRILQAILLGYFVRIMLNEGGGDGLFDDGYFISFLITLSGAAIGLLHHQYFFYGWKFGMQVRIAMSSIIYDKSVRLHMRSLSRTESSHIINLSSQDVEAFQQAGIFIHFLYVPILEAVAILWVGIREVGLSFISGFACVILLVPLQSIFSRALTQIRTTLGHRTDERIKLVSQAIGGARLMKINGWELAFKDIIGAARKLEMSSMLKLNYIKGVNEAIFFFAPVVIGAVTFITFHETGGELTPQNVFTVLTLYSIIQFSLTKFFPLAVQFQTQAYVAVQRTESLLLLEEISDSVSGNSSAAVDEAADVPTSSGDAGDVMIALKNFEASWEVEDEATQTAEQASPDAGTSGGDIELGGNVSSDQLPRVLSGVNMEIRQGELVVVVGPVGSSKTSLLMAMMGELAPLNNKKSIFSRKGTLAYCSQEPWIMSTTVKNNILFGLDFQEDKYLHVLKACDLLSDLQLLSNGDETTIGDRGINLSGGQRARIGLARAVYADADVYLLDDPLSAVDPKVGNSLFQKTICQALSSKTRVLVTHQTQFLSSMEVSRVAVLKSGKLVAFDSFSTLKSSGSLDWLGDNEGDLYTNADKGESQQHLSGHLIEDVIDDDEVSELGAGSKVSKSLLTMQNMRGHSVRYLSVDNTEEFPRARTKSRCSDEMQRRYSVISEEGTPKLEDSDRIVLGFGVESAPSEYRSLKDIELDIEKKDSSVNAADEDAQSQAVSEIKYTRMEAEVDGGIIAAENKNTGNINNDSYGKYFEAMGGYFVITIGMTLMLLGQASAMYCTVWLAYWAGKSDEEQDDNNYQNIYIGLVVGCCIFSLARSAMAFVTTTRAAYRLHDAMLSSVLRATVLFFDSNPLGRVLNRFSKDQFFVDDLLPPTFYDFIQCGLMVAGAVVLVCVGSPMIIIILVPLVPFFLYLRRSFLQTSREVKRLDALRRSPVFSHIAESLDGLTTIRAYGKLNDFKVEHKALVDAHTRPDFAFMAASRWLGFRLDVTVVALMTASTFGAVAAAQYGLGGSPEALSAGVMYVLQLAGLFQWCIRQSAEVENMMVSVERIVEYGRLPSEKVLHGPKDISARPNWPEKGLIEAKDLSCSYREGSPLVLRGVSFTFQPGERVGVVGRTGAGKSTLMSVLLRLIEYQEGTILIDGVDIKDIGLHDLRPKISVIPQVPFLFSGTVRQNMDVFDNFTDDEIWRSLDCVALSDAVRKLDGGSGLSGVVSENGTNFSVGERQLFCLARAILQRNNILIMDEATANVDLETDEKVQLAIKKEFSTSTVLMVAHRILTVIDCDQILVMSEGQIFETGHPYQLLAKYFGEVTPDTLSNLSNEELVAKARNIPKNTLASMVTETGFAMTRQLIRLAFSAWQLKKSKKSD